MMKEQPLVSLFVLCYNHEKYIDDCMQGLLSQTYENIQLIIFDDESQDGSWEKLSQYRLRLENKFPQVIMQQHKNKGATQETLLALEHVTGDFYCHLESDDYYAATKVEKNVRYLLEHPDVGLVHSDIDYLYPERTIHSFRKASGDVIPTGKVFNALVKGNFIQMCSVCMRTDLLRKYVDLKGYQKKEYRMVDHSIFLDMAQHTSIGFIPESLASYRVREESASHSRNPKEFYLIHKSAKRIRLDFSQKYDAPLEVRKKLEEEYYRYLFKKSFDFFLENDYQTGLEWFKKEHPESNFNTLGVKLRQLALKNIFLWFFVRFLLKIYGSLSKK